MKLEKPVEIPASGFLKYKELIFDPQFQEDKWIKELEFSLRPKVIHHVSIFIVDRKLLSKIIKSRKTKPDKLHFIGKKAPGWTYGDVNYKNFGKNRGIKIPKKHFFMIYIHYEPIGEKITDSETSIKIKFHSETPKYSLLTFSIINTTLNIPPHHNNFLDEIKYKIKRSVKLAGVNAHMHLRGKASSITVVDPEGHSEEIFRNTYNFNFQSYYMLEKPLLIRKGSTIICKNWFDNSVNNLVNPDPYKNVKWGFNISDEMSACVLFLVVPSSQYNKYMSMKSYIDRF